MKIAVSAYGRDLDSQLDSRFGRCSYFLVVNPDEMSFEAFKNESAVLGGGAGIQSAQFIASKGVDAVITGNCGPNAVRTLSAAGIELYAGQTGTVREVVERFKKGDLSPTREANVDSHSGMAPGSGLNGASTGVGGMGRGMGGGRSMGRGMASSPGMDGDPSVSGQRKRKRKQPESASKNLELETLKKKADDINMQLEGLLTRINRLETRG